jgi:hypothetical protein
MAVIDEREMGFHEGDPEKIRLFVLVRFEPIYGVIGSKAEPAVYLGNLGSDPVEFFFIPKLLILYLLDERFEESLLLQVFLIGSVNGEGKGLGVKLLQSIIETKRADGIRIFSEVRVTTHFGPEKMSLTNDGSPIADSLELFHKSWPFWVHIHPVPMDAVVPDVLTGDYGGAGGLA